MDRLKSLNIIIEVESKNVLFSRLRFKEQSSAIASECRCVLSMQLGGKRRETGCACSFTTRQVAGKFSQRPEVDLLDTRSRISRRFHRRGSFPEERAPAKGKTARSATSFVVVASGALCVVEENAIASYAKVVRMYGGENARGNGI